MQRLKNEPDVVDLEEIYIQGEGGKMVQLDALGSFHETIEDKSSYHKNLRRAVFVYAEVAGRPPADAIVDVQWDQVSVAENAAVDAIRWPTAACRLGSCVGKPPKRHPRGQTYSGVFDLAKAVQNFGFLPEYRRLYKLLDRFAVKDPNHRGSKTNTITPQK